MAVTDDMSPREGAGLLRIRLGRVRSSLKRYWPYYLMIAPALIWLAMFLAWPMLQGILISFQKFGLMGSQGYVGFDNYLEALQDRTVIQATINTVLITIGITISGTLLPIIPAIALAEITPRPMRSLLQSAIYAPHLLGWVIIIGIWVNVLSPIGLVNSILNGLGLIDGPIPFFSSPHWGQPLVIGLTTWKDLGFHALIYYAALMTLNTELIEAAAMDGANGLQRIRDVVIPHLMPAIRVVLLITVLGASHTFDSAFLMLNGRTAETVRTLAIFTYERGILRFDLGVASAAGVILLIFSLLLGLGVRMLPGFKRQGL
ncbi:MAG: ABC transporter permease subunit [Pelagibacterium sp.]|jgi:putative aldouronate transport system permease protein|uniref:ABC transporter permease subunit n=1 Tax=Pelagibacterium sp. TaxID=1967288 RepID=UPI0032EAA04C|tara:strand:+ start:21182 stop:22132 length:951 start_codon:yes stop_codon:yes gene_type:complete